MNIVIKQISESTRYDGPIRNVIGPYWDNARVFIDFRFSPSTIEMRLKLGRVATSAITVSTHEVTAHNWRKIEADLVCLAAKLRDDLIVEYGKNIYAFNKNVMPDNRAFCVMLEQHIKRAGDFYKEYEPV